MGAGASGRLLTGTLTPPLQGTNLNKAMTLQEAEAFVGAERCIMKTLTETDLYCEPPEVQPPPKRRQKRDTANNLPEFIVRRDRVLP